MKKLYTYILFFIVSCLLLVPVFSFAQTSDDINVTLPTLPGGTREGTDPVSIIYNLYDTALLLGGLLAFGAIVYGGIKYTLAAGNPSGQTEGKEWIKQALYGLLLLFGVYTILNVINPELTNIKLPKLAKLPKIEEGKLSSECTTKTLSIEPAGNLPDGSVRLSYGPEILTVSGGIPPYGWTSPDIDNTYGLILLQEEANTAKISGIPTATGTFNFTVEVVDGTQCKGSQAYTVTITEAPSPTMLMIRTEKLPSIQQGVNYSTKVVATGGEPPYTWTTVGSQLPPGISLNPSTGDISGKTNAPVGSYVVKFKVTDSASTEISRDVSYEIVLKGDACDDPKKLAEQHGASFKIKNSDDLDEIIKCVIPKLPAGMLDMNQIYTFEREPIECNYTRKDGHCKFNSACEHRAFSCHYGGRYGINGAEAVDFNAKPPYTEKQLYNALLRLAGTCNFGFILAEPNEENPDHTHVSTKNCDGN